jgi:phosphoribosylamine-glycine ligase
MKYLIISIVGCGFYMAPRLAKASDTEKVYYWCRDNAKMEKVGKDMENLPGWEKFEKVKDFGQVLKQNNKEDLVIIFDDTGMGFTADILRSQGWKVVQGGELAEKLEGDRWWAIQMMKKVMKVPETVYYNTFEEGIAFLKSQDKEAKFFFKPQDPEVPKDKTYGGKVKDVISAMQTFKTEWQWGDGFVLQLAVDGYEGDMSAYFVNGEYIPNSMNWYFENKAFLVGDKGSATGGEIAVSFFRPMAGKVKEIFDKLKPLLTKANYNGQIAINCMFSKEDHEPYFLEHTPRFGYPSLEIYISYK